MPISFRPLSAGGNITSQQSPRLVPSRRMRSRRVKLTASAAWNLDFWGKYRRATEAARANLLANRVGAEGSDGNSGCQPGDRLFSTSSNWILNWKSRSARYDSRQDSLQLTQTLEQHGINSMLDVRQSEQLVYTAATEVPDLERQIAQQENAITMLLGNNPGDVPRGLKLTEQPHAPEVPSDCLRRCWNAGRISGRRNKPGCGQRADRRGARRVLSADLSNRNGRVSESGTDGVCSPARQAYGVWQARSRSRFSKADG